MSNNPRSIGALGRACFFLMTFLVSPVAAAPSCTGDIYVADENAFGGSGGVIRVDPTTGAQTVVSSGQLFVDPRGIAVDGSGQIIIADPNAFGGNGGLIGVDPTTGFQTTISSGGAFSEPLAVTIDENGDFLVADAGFGFGVAGSLIHVDPTTGNQTVVSDDDNKFIDPHGVAVNPAGDIFVSDFRDVLPEDSNSKILHVDGATGTQTVVSSAGSLQATVHLVVEPAGTIVVASLVTGLQRVDPSTGDQSEVTALAQAAGVDLDSSNDIIAVSNNPVVGLVHVDPITGTKTTISTDGIFDTPQGVAVAPCQPTSTPTATSTPTPTVPPTFQPPCAPAPLSCKSAGRAVLIIKDKIPDLRDKLVWKITNGEATATADFADPTQDADYSLCVYAGGSVRSELSVPTDGNLWRPISTKGFRYRDRDLTHDGVKKIILKGSITDRTRAIVLGKGGELPDLEPPLPLPVVVQLVNSSTGVCWGSSFDSLDVRKNEPGKFVGKTTTP